MKRNCLLLLLLFRQLCVSAQQQPSFKPLRYDDNLSYLKTDSSKDFYNKVKYSPLSKSRNTYLSFGGDVRYQYFYFKNEAWGKEPDDKDGYILSRYLFHADLHAGHYFRTFVQLQSSLANGKITASPVDENQLDLHQAFFDIKLPLAQKNSLTIRTGRQELLYGSQRIVSVREGPNNRQAFDAARLLYSSKQIKADAFFSHYVLAQRAIFDDHFNKNTKFWGGYVVVNKIPVLQNIDLYYLGLWKSKALFDDGLEKELRHSVGTRIWNRSANWQYDFEALYQWGKFGTGHIAAWTLSSNTTYTMHGLPGKPQINLKTELISGDKKYDDGKLNSFNPLFPRGAYFGYAALIGPENLADIHPALSFTITRSLQLDFDYDAFWRFSKNDGLYGPSGFLIYTGKNTTDKFVGQQYAVDFIYTPNNFVYIRAEFTWSKAGDFLKAAGPGKDILFTGITTQVKF